METKRLIIAIALSMVVIVLYQYLFVPDKKPLPPKPAEKGQVEPGKKTTQPTAADQQTAEKKKSKFLFVEEEPKVTETTAAPDETKPVIQDIAADKEQTITIETDLYIATMLNKGAGMKSFVLKKYKDDKGNLLNLISKNVEEKPFGIYPFYFSTFVKTKELAEFTDQLNSQNYHFNGQPEIYLTENQTTELVFKYADSTKNLQVTKSFVFSNNSYVVGINYEILKDGKPFPLPILFGPGLENNVRTDRVMQSPLRMAGFDGQDVQEKTFSAIKLRMEDIDGERIGKSLNQWMGNLYWVAYDTTYFAAIFKTSERVDYAVLKREFIPAPVVSDTPEGEEEKKAEKPVKHTRLYSYLILKNPKEVFLGPKDEDILGALEKNDRFFQVTKVVDYGWGFIGGIASIMLKGIKLIYSIIPNWGWALVIFTLFIKILLFPLTYTSMVSMAKMQALQPKIKALKKKYKNPKDPEQRKAMQMEQMALFKSEKVNPAGGCLPMLLQMPILFAFFRLLPISINFRHEPWMLWISDLSVKDPIYLLPILMGLTQIIVSKISPTSAEGGQKKMMYIMPVIMVILFMNYSAGLNLYWFISNLIQIGQQKIINERIFKQKKIEERQRKAQKRKKGAKSK